MPQCRPSAAYRPRYRPESQGIGEHGNFLYQEKYRPSHYPLPPANFCSSCMNRFSHHRYACFFVSKEFLHLLSKYREFITHLSFFIYLSTVCTMYVPSYVCPFLCIPLRIYVCPLPCVGPFMCMSLPCVCPLRMYVPSVYMPIRIYIPSCKSPMVSVCMYLTLLLVA